MRVFVCGPVVGQNSWCVLKQSRTFEKERKTCFLLLPDLLHFFPLFPLRKRSICLCDVDSGVETVVRFG